MMNMGLTMVFSLAISVCGIAGSDAAANADPQIENVAPALSGPKPLLSASDPNQPAAKESAQTAQTVQKSEQLQRQIRMLQVSAMEPNQPAQGVSLQHMIQQLQSLQMPAQVAGMKTVPPVEPKTESTPTVQPQPAVQAPVEPAQAGLARLDQVTEPLNAIAAADALYRMKDYARAMRFYEVAIDTAKSNVMNRQWAMYQSANCMRCQDADRAVELYGRLIAEYPNSPWSSAALAQRKNLEWLKKNQAELKQRIPANDPNSL
ncbi:MAG: tetratricopeptide repeat protein [Anaerohalosphaeraceae bacterium]